MTIQVTTDVQHFDGGSSRTQTIIGDDCADVIAMYRLLAEIDAKVATDEAMQRIGAIESH